jgi:hypothetical protein
MWWMTAVSFITSISDGDGRDSVQNVGSQLRFRTADDPQGYRIERRLHQLPE